MRSGEGVLEKPILLTGLDALRADPKSPHGGPPLHKWDPPFTGDLDMVIAADGSWFHEGEKIERQGLVRLFGTILRKEADGHHYLVTPAEKMRIRVEDAPFLGVRIDVAHKPHAGSAAQADEPEAGANQRVTVLTNHDDSVLISQAHPLRVALDPETEEPAPYVGIRYGLEAKLTRAAFYDLVDQSVVKDVDGAPWHGVWSDQDFFPIAPYREES